MSTMAVALSIFFSTILLFTVTHVNSATSSCSINTYSPNSTFHENLKFVLSNLTITASSTNSNFYNSSFGQKNDTVYGLYLCQGDLTAMECSSCIVNITQSIIEDCPNHKESISWESTTCMLRYANRNIFSREEELPERRSSLVPAITQRKNGTQLPLPPVLPTYNRTKVIDDLINETAFGDHSERDKTRFYTTREDKVRGSLIPEIIYSLAQCTPDLSQLMCHKCLTQASKGFSCCAEIELVQILLPSCMFKMSTSKFFRTENERPTPNNTHPAPSLPPTHGNENIHKPKGSSHIPIAIAVSSAVAILLLSGFCFFKWKRNMKPSFNDDNEIITMDSLQYNINTIKTATNNFHEDNKLGQGGFGDVYKGKLQSGQEIAVKRLSAKSKQGIQEFKTEVLLVAKLQHKNLVKLLGFCVTEEEKLLIYEYLPYSSLDRLLFDCGEAVSLVWETRYKIIDGIAKGLLYLHEDSRYKIIHRDLKPSNILLDKDMMPKISDFGIAKLFGEDQEQDISKRIVGTQGYMAPEYIRSGQLSFKSDVYSFGVLVLEIVSGIRIRSGFIHTPENQEGLLQRAMRLWNAKEPLAFVESRLSGNFPAEEATQCIHIGLLCTQENADRRPTMDSIVHMLNSYSDGIPQLSPEGQFNRILSRRVDQSITYSGMDDITSLTGR